MRVAKKLIDPLHSLLHMSECVQDHHCVNAQPVEPFLAQHVLYGLEIVSISRFSKRPKTACAYLQVQKSSSGRSNYDGSKGGSHVMVL